MGRGTFSTGGLRVEVLSQLSQLDLHARALAALNLASRRPTPFHTLEYFKIFLEHDELRGQGGPLLMLAFDAGRPIGLLPLRRRTERVLGLPSERIELLMAHDAERGSMIARSEDEERCARAFVRHLFSRDNQWDVFELADQEQTAPLGRAAFELASPFMYVRRFPACPSATVPLLRGFDGWLESLPQPTRTNLLSRTRTLLEAAEVEFIACADRNAVRALLPLFLDLEARSWKREARAGIGRHATVIKRFDAMLGASQPATPLFHFLRIDGLPVAGMLSLIFGGAVHQQEIVADESFEKHNVAHVLMMLAMRDACQRGVEAYHLRSDVAHAKARYGAQVTETAAVQVYKRLGPAHVKARLGELKRRILSAPVSAPPRQEPTVDPLVPAAARTKAAVALAALVEKGAHLETLGNDGLSELLFPSERRSEPFAATAS
jgi:hypothetical protein